MTWKMLPSSSLVFDIPFTFDLSAFVSFFLPLCIQILSFCVFLSAKASNSTIQAGPWWGVRARYGKIPIFSEQLEWQEGMFMYINFYSYHFPRYTVHLHHHRKTKKPRQQEACEDKELLAGKKMCIAKSEFIFSGVEAPATANEEGDEGFFFLLTHHHFNRSHCFTPRTWFFSFCAQNYNLFTFCSYNSLACLRYRKECARALADGFWEGDVGWTHWTAMAKNEFTLFQ